MIGFCDCFVLVSSGFYDDFDLVCSFGWKKSVSGLKMLYLAFFNIKVSDEVFLEHIPFRFE